jgi:hypothetical protein
MGELCDPRNTISALLTTYWTPANTGNRTPTINDPSSVKRHATTDNDVIDVYEIGRTEEKAGVMNAYRNRRDTVAIDICCAVSRAQMNLMIGEVQRILDIYRSNPTATPATAVNQYDQIIPVNGRYVAEYKAFWRYILDVELLNWWEPRQST